MSGEPPTKKVKLENGVAADDVKPDVKPDIKPDVSTVIMAFCRALSLSLAVNFMPRPVLGFRSSHKSPIFPMSTTWASQIRYCNNLGEMG